MQNHKCSLVRGAEQVHLESRFFYSKACAVHGSFSDNYVLLLLSSENISVNMNLDLINIYIYIYQHHTYYQNTHMFQLIIAV